MEVAEPVLRAVGARLGDGGEVIVVPGNHDGELVRPWLRARRCRPMSMPPSRATRRPCSRESRPGSDPLMSGSVIRASGWGSVCGRPTATISIVTYCRKQPMESPAGCWACAAGWRRAGRLRARRRPIRDAAGGVVYPLLAAPTRGACGGLGGVPARSHHAGHPAAPADPPRCAAPCDAAWSADATGEHPRARPGGPPAPARPRLGHLWARAPLRASHRRRSPPLAGSPWATADRQHRLLGVRAAARSSRGVPPPVLARRGHPARGGS